MDKLSLEFITNYIKSDNETNLELYNYLFEEYKRSLTQFNSNINILGIYFYDILKILTHINLKKREIDQNILVNTNNDYKILKFPYYSVSDIINGINLNEKIFGKILFKNQNKILKIITNLKNIFFPKNKVILSCPTKIDDKYLIYAKNKITKKKFIFNYFIGKNFYKVPLLNDQLINLEIILKKIQKNFFINQDNLKLSELIKLHILANCKQGKEKIKKISDYLIIDSGVELRNRLITSVAKQNNIKIIQISHGDSYGVFDEPLWSVVGDQFNADYILGYGNGYKKYKYLNKFIFNKDAIYINGTSKPVNEIQNKLNFNKNISSEKKFVYFPTTFSGYTKRHGPYRDMPDKLYKIWHKKLNKLFQNKLIFKIHPKEKNINIYDDNLIINKDNILNYLENDYILIFDHISTAFNIAASSNNSIIYFDLGTRNLNNEALNNIKKRVVYYKIKNQLPNLDELISKLNNKDKDHSYSKNFCIGFQETRLRSLIYNL